MVKDKTEQAKWLNLRSVLTFNFDQIHNNLNKNKQVRRPFREKGLSEPRMSEAVSHMHDDQCFLDILQGNPQMLICFHSFSWSFLRRTRNQNKALWITWKWRTMASGGEGKCQVCGFSSPKIFAFNALSRVIIIGC